MRRIAQGYYCGFPVGRAAPPDPCTKPYNPWLSCSPCAGSSPEGGAAEKRPAYGCHLHHQQRLQNIQLFGVKDSWVEFSQWHDAEGKRR